MINIGKTELDCSVQDLARTWGASEEEAEIFSRCHVRANLRGHYTQGIQLLPIVAEMIESGEESFGTKITTQTEEEAFSIVDGGGGVGCIVATKAMSVAIDKAQSAGIGCVWVRHGGIFSMASNYTLQAMERSHVGVATENGIPFVAPWGGRDPFFSTNPFSIAVPSNSEIPIVIDMSAGSFSAGMVMNARRQHRKMSSPHLVDSQGNYTDDPQSINMDEGHQVDSSALVAHGYRGFAWMIFVEILAGLLSGMDASYMNFFDPKNDRNRLDHGQFFMAINISALMPVDDFTTKVDHFIRALKASRPAAGFDEVRYPGENAGLKEKEYLQTGIPIDETDWEVFQNLLKRYTS